MNGSAKVISSFLSSYNSKYYFKVFDVIASIISLKLEFNFFASNLPFFIEISIELTEFKQVN